MFFHSLCRSALALRTSQRILTCATREISSWRLLKSKCCSPPAPAVPWTWRRFYTRLRREKNNVSVVEPFGNGPLKGPYWKGASPPPFFLLLSICLRLHFVKHLIMSWWTVWSTLCSLAAYRPLDLCPENAKELAFKWKPRNCPRATSTAVVSTALSTTCFGRTSIPCWTTVILWSPALFSSHDQGIIVQLSSSFFRFFFVSLFLSFLLIACTMNWRG